MDEEIQEKIYTLLNTFGDALDWMENASPDAPEAEGVRKMLSESRAEITKTLENALNISLRERININSLSDEDWLNTAVAIMGELTDPFQPKNAYDWEFQNLLNYIWTHTEFELVEAMRKNLEKIGKLSGETLEQFVSYFSRFPLWGTFDPRNGDFTTFELRAAVLKRHSYDFLWLYRRLEDYLSKRTLNAILLNWAILDMSQLQTIKSVFPDYWEPDIFPDNQNDVFVDVGAYIGDSIETFVKFYGTGYRRIYAYEISRGSYETLRRNIERMNLSNVIPRRKGAGPERSVMMIHANPTNASANQLQRMDSTEETVADSVEVVPLDEDIHEPVTLIKMDIEGAEQGALIGCAGIIREQRPKLAICTYHGYEDIYKIPILINSLYPGYRFYMRHNGGNMIPTEFTLLCAP